MTASLWLLLGVAVGGMPWSVRNRFWKDRANHWLTQANTMTRLYTESMRGKQQDRFAAYARGFAAGMEHQALHPSPHPHGHPCEQVSDPIRDLLGTRFVEENPHD